MTFLPPKPDKQKDVRSWKLEMVWFGIVVGFTIGFILGSVVTGFFKQLI